MEKQRKTKLVTGLALLLCVVAIAVGVRLTWAAYTSNDYLKAVASTNQTTNLFGSNYLVGCESEPNEGGSDITVVPIVATTTDTEASFTIDIYNYLLDNKTMVNAKDIAYDLTITAEGLDDVEWSINGASIQGSAEKTYSDVRLPASTATMNSVALKLPKSALGSARFKVVVKVREGSDGTSLWGLAALIVPGETAVTQPASVSGTFIYGKDKNGQEETPAAHDAYNYEINVSGGEAAQVTLTWNPSVVEIEPFFEQKFGVAPTVGVDSASVTFTCQPGGTIVNFYRAAGTTSAPADWNAMGVSVAKASTTN